MILFSNLLLLVGLVFLVVAAALVSPAAGFGAAGAACVFVSRRAAL